LTSWLWIVFTVAAAGGQTLRNAMQRELTAALGTVGATHVRFLYGLPFSFVFLAIVLAVTGEAIPRINVLTVVWVFLGAVSQIVATALMLAAMKERSFIVTTALIKVEPVWVALFGLIVLGDHLSFNSAIAILLATIGVTMMSWPKASALGASPWTWRPIIEGLVSGALFGVAAVFYRGGILEIRRLGADNFVVAATTILVVGLLLSCIVLTAYLLLFDRKGLREILRAWRPSLFAGFMGATASQMWFLAFAIETAARVRTLGLVEVLFAQMVSRNLFKQSLASREAVGIGLIILGVLLLLNG
jgi:drug/metabolite transporter (DMT)-like permease